MLRSALALAVGSLVLACSAAPPTETIAAPLVREEDDGGAGGDASENDSSLTPSGECEHVRPDVGAPCSMRGACYYAVDEEAWGDVTLVVCTCDAAAWFCRPARP